MRREWIEHLACPRTRAAYDLDPVRVAGDEVVEAFLVSQDERDVRPVVAGVAVLPRDLRAHLQTQGNVYRRSPINDPRLARFLLSRAGSGYVIVPFDTVVAAYRDLAQDPPPGYETDRPAADRALLEALDALRGAERGARALHVGCGVGRTVFDLCARFDAVLGLDDNLACVRRARNVAVTREHFFLPAPKDSGRKEIPLDLSSLVRAGADFAVADAHALPLRDRSVALVVLSIADDPHAAAAVAEAQRVLAPGGVLAWPSHLSAVGRTADVHCPPWSVARLP